MTGQSLRVQGTLDTLIAAGRNLYGDVLRKGLEPVESKITGTIPTYVAYVFLINPMSYLSHERGTLYRTDPGASTVRN